MIFFMMHKFLCEKPMLICFPSVHQGQTLRASLPLPKGQITSIPVDLAVRAAPCPAGVAQLDQWSYAAPATGLMCWFSRAQYTQVNYERPGCQQREIKVNLQLLITDKIVLKSVEIYTLYFLGSSAAPVERQWRLLPSTSCGDALDLG